MTRGRRVRKETKAEGQGIKSIAPVSRAEIGKGKGKGKTRTTAAVLIRTKKLIKYNNWIDR